MASAATFSTAEFSEPERGRILHFLGYPDWRSLASSIQLGFPSGSQPLFLVEQSVDSRIGPAGRQSVRLDLCNLEAIEGQLADARSRFKAMALGELKLQPRETDMLRKELVFWQRRLADDLGVVFNPYSSMAWEGMPGGMNAKVQ